MVISQSRPSRRLFRFLPNLVFCLLLWITPAAHSGWFTELSAASGLDFTHFNGMSGEFYLPEIMGPGAALFDYDSDGDTDILVANNAGPTRLLRNDIGSRADWLGLDVRGRTGGPAIGARVELRFADGLSRWYSVRTDGSYASAKDSRILVGLGSETGPQEVRVHWPDGKQGIWKGLPMNRYSTLRRP